MKQQEGPLQTPGEGAGVECAVLLTAERGACLFTGHCTTASLDDAVTQLRLQAIPSNCWAPNETRQCLA